MLSIITYGVVFVVGLGIGALWSSKLISTAKADIASIKQQLSTDLAYIKSKVSTLKL